MNLKFLFLFFLNCILLSSTNNQPIKALWVVRDHMVSEELIDEVLVFAENNNFNHIFAQVRGRGDAYYNSSIVPKSHLVDIDFDPLNVQIMIRTFVKDGIESFDLNIIDMEEGGSKKYNFIIKGEEECIFDSKKLNCIIVERSRSGSERKVNYYLARELEYMFTKIIDSSPERTNKLELQKILSLG